jgi:hypothetical protein
MKKNDRVKLLNDTPLPWSARGAILPAGTELLVSKVSRKDGKVNVYGPKELHGSVLTVDQSAVQTVLRNAPMPKVGDLFYSSWGYDQTNIDFYQVTAVTGKSIWLTPIAGQAHYTQTMAGQTKPIPNRFTGEAKRHLVRFDQNDQPAVRLTSYSYAWPTTADVEHFFSEWA